MEKTSLPAFRVPFAVVDCEKIVAFIRGFVLCDNSPVSIMSGT